MKKIAILILASIGLLLAQSALAAPPGGTPTTHIATFDIGAGTANATVNSGVYQCTAGEYIGKYVYTYQITNVTSGVGLSFFSVGVTNGANVIDPGSDQGAIIPSYWEASGDNPPTLVQSVDASFGTPIKNAQSSTLLWFVSDYGPTMGQGFLFGTSARVPQYDSSELFAPVPEPATISLLAIGGILAARARRRNNV
jgi:hypothetical protein